MEKPGLLSVAALFAFLVAVYQVISIVLGRTVLMPPDHSNANSRPTLPASETPYLRAADTSEFIRPDSVVEGTTELLPTAGRADIKSRER